MDRSSRIFSAIAAFSTALAVAMGAFGAHALKARLAPEMLSVYQTAVHYHFIHALGLFALSFASALLNSPALFRVAGWTMIAGTLIFSGSLYVLSISGMRWLGAVTPLGGIALMTAWVLLGVALFRAKDRAQITP